MARLDPRPLGDRTIAAYSGAARRGRLGRLLRRTGPQQRSTRVDLGSLRSIFGFSALGEGNRRADEPIEERVRPLGAALELRVELTGDEPGVILQFDDFDEAPGRRLAGQHHTGSLEERTVSVVDLEAMAVPLVNELRAIDHGGLRAGGQPGWIQAQAHRAALVLHRPLVRHEVDDRVLRKHVEFGRVGVFSLEDVAGELDYGALQAQTQPQERQPALARMPGGEDLALDTAMAETAGNHDATQTGELLAHVLLGQALGVHPANLDVHFVGPTGMLEGLDDR